MPRQISIWDLDYYYAEKKKNQFNVDLMRISSYHKQLGDSVNFVEKEEDIYRPYDVYYISKEKDETPNAPVKFLNDPRVKWLGECYKYKGNYIMPPEVSAIRPDYLLYKEKTTKEERSNYLCFFDFKGHLLKLRQDQTNAQKNKFSIVWDKNFWNGNDEDLIKALEELESYKNISFHYPVDIKRLISNNKARDLFIGLKFIKGSQIIWQPVDFSCLKECVSFISDLQQAHKNTISFKKITCSMRTKDYWSDKSVALQDWYNCVEAIKLCKHNKAIFYIPTNPRSSNPYYELFDLVANWKQFKVSWLEWITAYCTNVYKDQLYYWLSPLKWSSIFRDLLRQTWKDKEFLILKWGDEVVKDVPYEIFRKEFEKDVW